MFHESAILSLSGDIVVLFNADTHNTVTKQMEVETKIEVLPCKNMVPYPTEEEAPMDEPYSIANSRGKKITKSNPKYADSIIAYALSVAEETSNVEEPPKYVDAISTPDSASWLIAMNEELESLHKNTT